MSPFRPPLATSRAWSATSAPAIAGRPTRSPFRFSGYAAPKTVRDTALPVEHVHPDTPAFAFTERIGFIDYAQHIRRTVEPNWLEALGTVGALSLVIAIAVICSRK